MRSCARVVEELRWSYVLLALIAMSCASTPRPPAIEEDGVALWRRVETAHFVVEGNGAREASLRRVARELETLWSAFSMVPVLGRRPPEVKPLVVVLRSESEFHYIASSSTAAYFAHNTALGPMIVMPASSGPFRATVVKHELAHFVSSKFLGAAPLWLAEGLAQVMETASYDSEEGELVLGAHSENLVASSAHRLPAERFLAKWPERLSGLEASRFYGRSWLLVHLLIDHHLPAFADFLARVSRGDDWRTAWRSSRLPAFEQLDDLLQEYHRRAWYGLWRVAAPFSDVDPFESSPVSISDALALRAVLIANAPLPARSLEQRLEEARRDLARARAADPNGERARRAAAAFELAATSAAVD